MFGFKHLQHERVINAKKILDSGKYGKLLWMRGRYGKSKGRLKNESFLLKGHFQKPCIFLSIGADLIRA